MYRYVISVQICYLQSVQFTSVQILDSVYKYVSCDGRCIIKKVRAEYSLREETVHVSGRSGAQCSVASTRQ